MKTDEVTKILEHAISKPPCRLGMRLRSERELADILDTGISRIRTSISRLEKKGLLVRKQGSGTFVRRIGEEPGAEVKSSHLVDPVAFFKIDEGQPGPLRIETRLKLGLWGDLHFASFTSQQVYAAIIAQANRLGYTINVNSMFRSYRQPFSDEELIEQYEQQQYDGYIVIAQCAEKFAEITGVAKVPVVHFGGGNIPLKEPMVMFDTVETARRAVRIFAENGFTRIGLISLDSSESPRGLIRVEHAVFAEELRFRGYDESYIKRLNQRASINEVMEATRSLVKRQDRPEAVYVADDTFLPGVLEVLNAYKIRIGRDIGVITISNRGLNLPRGYNWSRLEFDAEALAERTMELLTERIVTGQVPESISIHSRWIAGETCGA